MDFIHPTTDEEVVILTTNHFMQHFIHTKGGIEFKEFLKLEDESTQNLEPTSTTPPTIQKEPQITKKTIPSNGIEVTFFVTANKVQDTDQTEESEEEKEGGKEEDNTSVGSMDSEDSEKEMEIDEKHKPYIKLIMHMITTYLPYIKACTVTLQKNYLEELNETQAIIKAGAKLNKIRTKSATSATKLALSKEKSVSPELLGTLIKETVSTEIGRQTKELDQVQKRKTDLDNKIRKKKELLRKKLSKREKYDKVKNQVNKEGAQQYQMETSRTQYTGGKTNTLGQGQKNTSSSFAKRQSNATAKAKAYSLLPSRDRVW